MFTLSLNTVVSFPADTWITPCPTVTTQIPGGEVGGAGVWVCELHRSLIKKDQIDSYLRSFVFLVKDMKR